MACGYGKDSTLNAEPLNPRAQLVKCCACSLLRWGLRIYPCGCCWSHGTQCSASCTGKWLGRCCSELITSSFHPPPHHPASPCAGAVPQGLDAQVTELGTCLWAHGPQLLPITFPPGNSCLFWWDFPLISTWSLINCLEMLGKCLEFVVCEGLPRPSKGTRTVLHRGASTPPKAWFHIDFKSRKPMFSYHRYGISP